MESPTLRRALELFETHLRADGRSPHTVSSYLRDLRQLERFLCEQDLQPEVSSVTAQVLDRFFSSPLATQRPDGGPKDGSSVGRAKSSLRAFFAWLHRSGFLESNPAEGVKVRRAERKPPAYLTEPEAKRLQKAVRSRTGAAARRDAAIFDLFLKTGLRLQELVDLDMDDVRLDEKRLIVRRGKGGKPDAKFLNEALRRTLKGYLAERKKLPAASDALFLSARMRRISPRQVAYRLQKWLGEAGVEKRLSPHALRHTFATNLFSKSRDLLIVQKALNHRSLETTRIYTHVAEERFQEAMECL